MAASAEIPVCGFTFDGTGCRKRGDHCCLMRARHVMAFFCELLTHTKGDYARKRVHPGGFQASDVLAPLFGEVIWDGWRGRYVRRYRILYLSMAARTASRSWWRADPVPAVRGRRGRAELYGMAMDAVRPGWCTTLLSAWSPTAPFCGTGWR